MKLLFTTALLGSLFLSSYFLEPVVAVDRAQPSFCGGKCAKRRQKAGVLDRCLKYCVICCQECKCVPSETYGNKHECPCYRDKVNSKGKPKCP